MIFQIITWLTWLLIGAGIGALAHLTRRTRQRWYNDLAIGIVGAFVGGIITDLFSFPGLIDLNLISTIGATIGAVLLHGLLWWINRRRIDAATLQSVRDTAESPILNERHATPHIRVGRRRIATAIALVVVVALPLLHLVMLWLRLPSISIVPPPFGTVSTYGTLDYVVVEPASAASSPTPLVVLLHGCGQDPTVLEASSAMRAIADANGFTLVYPQQNFITSPHRCWNWYDERNQVRDSGEPSLLVGIVQQVARTYPIDSSRVYVGGLSSGGAMTSILASCYPDVFAAAAVLSGMAYKSSTSLFEAIAAPLRGNQTPPEAAGRAAHDCAGSAARIMPVFNLHGAADTVVFPINSDHTVVQMAQMNDYADDGIDNGSISDQPAAVRSEQIPDGHAYSVETYEAAGAVWMVRYRIEGMWHMWSGGTGVLPLSDPNSPDAGNLIWTFFREFSLPAA